MEREREDDQIVVVLPEFVPAKLWEKVLHNHSGLMLKVALLHKPNVVVCNYRYFLAPFCGPVLFREEKQQACAAAQQAMAAAEECPHGTMPEPPVTT